MSITVIDLLDALRTHLDECDVPAPYSVHLTTHHLPETAGDLLAWADTLTETTTEAWRVPCGDSLHLSVTGRLSESVQVQVYGSLPFTLHGIGADLAPGASTTVPLAVVRERATPGEVTF